MEFLVAINFDIAILLEYDVEKEKTDPGYFLRKYRNTECVDIFCNAYWDDNNDRLIYEIINLQNCDFMVIGIVEKETVEEARNYGVEWGNKYFPNKQFEIVVEPIYES